MGLRRYGTGNRFSGRFCLLLHDALVFACRHLRISTSLSRCDVLAVLCISFFLIAFVDLLSEGNLKRVSAYLLARRITHVVSIRQACEPGSLHTCCHELSYRQAGRIKCVLSRMVILAIQEDRKWFVLYCYVGEQGRSYTLSHFGISTSQADHARIVNAVDAVVRSAVCAGHFQKNSRCAGLFTRLLSLLTS